MLINEGFGFDDLSKKKDPPLVKHTEAFPPIELHNSKTIAIYTALCILRRMRTQLGLEAMLEYLDSYLVTVDDNNPTLKNAVTRGIGMMGVEKIYRNAVERRKKK